MIESKWIRNWNSFKLSLSLPLEEGKSIDLSNLIFDPDQSPLKKEQWR